ncbi:MAG: VOC family protein [Pyrinomonadaceae bacterium]
MSNTQQFTSNFGARHTYLSHFGIRTKQLEPMIEWYKTVFRAKVMHRNESLAFMTFDEEHHRFVIFEDEMTVKKPDSAAGIDHIGFGLLSIGDLVATYERLKDEGITPFMPMNHRFTTSLYYYDPDGNEVEFSVDNFPTKEECAGFVKSQAMAEIGKPPFGFPFKADDLAELYHQGASAGELARIGIPTDKHE